jgi:multiple sugar transport system substrate-binding protein
MAKHSDEPLDSQRTLWVPWTRRKFLGTASLAAAGLAAGPLLEACGGGSESQTSSTPSGKVPQARSGASIRLLQWVHFVPAADQEFIRQCSEFGTKYGVKVAVERITGDQLQTKTAAAVESSSGPDIIQMQYAWPHLYANQSEDVTNEVNILKQKLGAVASVNDSFCKVNGVYRAVPYTIVPNAWTYRTDYFQKAGVSAWPKTWNEFTEAAGKLKAAGLPPISQTVGHSYGDALSMWNPVLWSHGGREVNSDGKTVAINSRETRDAIKWAQGAVKAGFVVHPEWLDADNNQAYHADRISATLNGGSIYLRERNEFHKFDKVSDNGAVPAGPKGTYTMNLIFNHAVMKYSPEKETAKALLLYLMDKDNYLKYTKVASGYNAGPFTAFDNDPVFFGPDADTKMKAFQAVVKPGKWPGWPAPASKQSAQAQTQYVISDMFGKALQNNGTGDIESVVKEAESRLKSIFERPS